ncbi:MAG: response regulator transcription factor [Bryobacteraceae bacterium]|nr:response regulator transcription factor [Bryobacteraceae bacterium]
MTKNSKHGTRVWVIEDNSNYRRMLQKALNASTDICWEASFSSMEEAMQALDKRPPPDVVLLDIGLPGMDGIEGMKQIRSKADATRLLILTVFDDDDKIFRAICAGASGYLLKSSPADEIVEAIGQVHEGGSPMHPRVARRVLETFQQPKSETSLVSSNALTEQEAKILRLMADGLTKKEIANTIHVSVHTVTFHMRRIYDRLHVRTNTGAVAIAIRRRII